MLPQLQLDGALLSSVCERVCVCDIWHTLEHAHHADHYHNHYRHDDELLMINKMMIKAKKKAHRFVDVAS